MSDVERRPWPRNPRFLVGDDGSIVGPSGRILSTFIGQYGYRRFNVYEGPGKWSQHSVHVVVCETFHGPRPAGRWAAHGNGDELDCRAVNLAWKTQAENEADKAAHGTKMEGERHHQHKLTAEDVRAIRSSSTRSGLLAAQYGVHVKTIRDARARRTWRCVA